LGFVAPAAHRKARAVIEPIGLFVPPIFLTDADMTVAARTSMVWDMPLALPTLPDYQFDLSVREPGMNALQSV
jgi:hypothetical protein